MRGLLLKDFYMAKRYCRSYFLIGAVFLAFALAGGGSLFFLFYPCLLSGMIPVTLLAYDERSKWTVYCEAMPYTRAQIVGVKYLIGLFSELAVLLLTLAVQVIRMGISEAFSLNELLILALLLLTTALLSPALSLPLMFKLGIEKGRIAYYAAIGLASACGVGASGIFESTAGTEPRLSIALPIVCLAAIALYALSFYLSVIFYKKREF